MKQIDNSIARVRGAGNLNRSGILQFGHKLLPCSLGEGGIVARKREGDGATPVGNFRILYGFYRPDRIAHLSSRINLFPLKPDYGWCDDPASRFYNQFVRLPFDCSHEKLWREDHLYDICLVLDYNISIRQRNAGSAIFFHLKHHDNRPTQGCVAISLEQMRKFLAQCAPHCQISVQL